MKITITKKYLQEVVSRVEKAVAKTNEIPVLTGILIVAKDKKIVLAANNNEIALREELKFDNLKIEEEGSIVLPAKVFSDITKKIRGKEIEITAENNNAMIISGKTQFQISGFDPEEFPKFQGVEGTTIRMNSDVLKHAFHSTVFAVSKNEARPVLTGVQILKVADSDEIIFHATDSHRLAKKVIKGDCEEINVVIPGNSIGMLTSILPKNKEIDLCFSSKALVTSFDGITFSSRLLSDTFPDVSRITQGNYKTQIVINRDDFLAALDCTMIVQADEKDKIVKLQYDKDASEVKVESVAKEYGKVEEVLAVQGRGDEIDISFNAQYVKDALKVLEYDDVGVSFQGNMGPFTIQPLTDKDKLHLVLPVRTR